MSCMHSHASYKGLHHLRYATRSLVNYLVISRLDYCNGLLYGIPRSCLNKLQNGQDAAARIITRTRRNQHITPVLKELHWIPVPYRVEIKILAHTYKALHDQAPKYTKDMLDTYRPSRNLRSQNSNLFVGQKSRTVKYGDRSFRHAAPR
ncbi:uncharacterized protein LOC128559238 [Mercenaria mercenaria]|uniref:uncharacterized protein LOC128559238 n=1 Tax=Mercenaria mercenaria TaxID=6596 RepID=UPI00234F2870|nr:uncharacterized protein LOC128559238 [Mercenaria mercenaria]